MDENVNHVWYMDRFSKGDKMCLIDSIPGQGMIDPTVYCNIFGFGPEFNYNFIYWSYANMKLSGWTLVSKDEVKFHA